MTEELKTQQDETLAEEAITENDGTLDSEHTESLAESAVEIESSEDAVEEQVEADFETLCAALDGLLLVQNKPISLEKLSAVMGISVERMHEVVSARKKSYDEDEKSGLQIAILENGVQLATKARISSFIQKLDGQKLVSLSLPALETLAVIAFKQPITKAEIDAIRGVNCDGVVSTLLEKKLIYVSGEKQVLGRPRLYSTTQDFLYYFGMKSLKELPLPSIDIPDQLTPEGQKLEAQLEQKESEKDFNDSQGLLPIEEKRDSDLTADQDASTTENHASLPEEDPLEQ